LEEKSTETKASKKRAYGRGIKKKLVDEINQAATELKGNKPIKLFFEDEGRFGRINKLTRCWCPGRQRAIIGQQKIREYTHVFTAVCPKTGETCSLILPKMNTDSMNIFLKELSETQTEINIILALDRAGWHTSKGLKVPTNIRLLFLPAYSPELNPAEHIWDYAREQKHFNNYTFDSLDQVEENLVNAFCEISFEKEIIRSLCYFDWLKGAA
jgi:transposase